MKILHTADWHLGIDLHKMSLLKDQKYFFDQLVTIVEQENVDVILICGDIYDTALASREAIQLFDNMMTTLCQKMKKEVIVIAGNHDSGERLSAMSRLLAPMGLHVYGKIQQIVTPLIIQDHAFLPIPYFHMETIRNIYQQPINSLDEAFSLILKEGLANTTGLKTIVMAHTFCANALISESDRFANIGGSDMVSADVFQKVDYVALGHLHKMQKLTEHVYYSGSPLPYSFSEAEYEKCVLIYDTKENTVTPRSIHSLHPLITLKGTFSQLQEMLQQPQEESAWYKVELSDGIVSYETMEYFREHLDHLLQLSGKNAALKETASIQLEEMEELSDLDIVRHFFLDHYEEELDEEEIQWFLEASEGKEEDYAS